jgi:hypothetical protein
MLKRRYTWLERRLETGQDAPNALGRVAVLGLTSKGGAVRLKRKGAVCSCSKFMLQTASPNSGSKRCCCTPYSNSSPFFSSLVFLQAVTAKAIDLATGT